MDDTDRVSNAGDLAEEIDGAIDELHAETTEAFMLVTTDGEQYTHKWHAPSDFRVEGVPVSQLLLASLLQSYAELTDESVDDVASGAAWAAKAVFGEGVPDPESNGSQPE